jgi:hypothetical protein
MRLTLNAYRPDRNQFVIESAWAAYHAVRLLSVWRMRRPAALGAREGRLAHRTLYLRRRP